MKELMSGAVIQLPQIEEASHEHGARRARPPAGRLKKTAGVPPRRYPHKRSLGSSAHSRPEAEEAYSTGRERDGQGTAPLLPPTHASSRHGRTTQRLRTDRPPRPQAPPYRDRTAWERTAGRLDPHLSVCPGFPFFHFVSLLRHPKRDFSMTSHDLANSEKNSCSPSLREDRRTVPEISACHILGVSKSMFRAIAASGDLETRAGAFVASSLRERFRAAIHRQAEEKIAAILEERDRRLTLVEAAEQRSALRKCKGRT